MNNREQIDKAFEILRWCFFFRYGKLLLCGNGGSAADCDHIAAELIKGMNTRAPYDFGLPAIALSSHNCLITAIVNDIGGEYIFSQQVFAMGDKGDVLWAITTSGKSPNILEAITVAKKRNMNVIALTGPYVDELGACDVVISCPGETAAEIQEQHIKVYHELCRRLEEEFYG